MGLDCGYYRLSISKLLGDEKWLDEAKARGGALANRVANNKICDRINQRCLEMFPGEQDPSMPTLFFRGGSNSDVISELPEVWDSNVRKHKKLVWPGEFAMKPFLRTKDPTKLGRITIYRLDPAFYDQELPKKERAKVHVQHWDHKHAPKRERYEEYGMEHPDFNDTTIFARTGYTLKKASGVKEGEVDAYISQKTL